MKQGVRISIRTALIILGLPIICHFISKAATLHPDSCGGIKGQTKELPVEKLDYYFRKITLNVSVEDGLAWDKTSYWKTSQEAFAAIHIGELGQRQIKGLE